jgi:hypothetical protein
MTDNDEVELSGAMYGMTQPLNMENSEEVNSSQIPKVIRTFRRQKEPLTIGTGFFTVDDNFIIGTNPLIRFHQNICGL